MVLDFMLPAWTGTWTVSYEGSQMPVMNSNLHKENYQHICIARFDFESGGSGTETSEWKCS